MHKHFLTSLIVSICMHAAGYGLDYHEVFSDPNDPNFIRVHEARRQFDRRMEIWKEYISSPRVMISSRTDDYVYIEQFRDLYEVGIVAVPWFMEDARIGVFIRDIGRDPLLRTDWRQWTGSKDYRPGDQLWSSSVPGDAPLVFTERMLSFRADLAAAPGDRAGHESVHWKRLCDVGVLGVPSVIARINEGLADEYDYRLMYLWTKPLTYTPQGRLILPAEPEVLPPGKIQPQYWLNWWQENQWQFWWMPQE